MTVAATGFFDGVHLGHRKVVSEVCAEAMKRGQKSKIISFWPHPRSVLRQDASNLRLLTSLEEKKSLLKGIGVDEVCILDFTKEFSRLSTAEFVDQYLKEKCGVDTLIVGYDHKFGHNPEETQSEMIEICRHHGLEVIRLDEFVYGGEVISSTKIRNLLDRGDIATANEYLGYRYGLKGVVVSGKHLGRTIGFPTANLRLYDPLKMIPQNGVYAVFVSVEGNNYIGICNIGLRPTVGESTERTIETYILDFDEDIYGLDMKIEFVGRIRDERKFDCLAGLKEQLGKDTDFARNLLTESLRLGVTLR